MGSRKAPPSNVASPKKTIVKTVAAPRRAKQTAASAAASTPAKTPTKAKDSTPAKLASSPAAKKASAKPSRDPVLAEGGIPVKGKRRVIQSSKLSDSDYFYDAKTTPQVRYRRRFIHLSTICVDMRYMISAGMRLL